MLADIIQSSLLACHGIVFDSRNACPRCGGILSGYDTKKKQFAVLQETDSLCTVHVFVKRFTCRNCHTLCFADEPFYPDTRIGSPIVDLCRVFSTTLPFNRVSATLLHLGVVVDRGTVRNYARRSLPTGPATNLFGVNLPLPVLSLADLATRFGEGGRIPGTEVLAACGFPSTYRAAAYHLLSGEQENEGEKQDHKKEGETQSP